MVLRFVYVYVQTWGFLWNWGLGCYHWPLHDSEEIMGPCWMMQWVHILYTALPCWRRLLVLAVTLCPVVNFMCMGGYKTTQNQYPLSQARAASTHNMPSQQIMRIPNLAEVARRASWLLRWQHASCHLPGFFYCSPCTPSRILFWEFHFHFRIRSTQIVHRTLDVIYFRWFYLPRTLQPPHFCSLVQCAVKFDNHVNVCTFLVSTGVVFHETYMNIHINVKFINRIRCFLCVLDRASSWYLNKGRPTLMTPSLLYQFTAQHVSGVNTSIFRSLRLLGALLCNH